MAIKEVSPSSKPTEKRKKKAFVIMPFSATKSCKDWDSIFDDLVQPAVNGSGFGYTCERSEIKGGAFIKDILMNLYLADVVIADLTDWNPNVFYELGVRHTLKNRTVLITQNIKDIPSDLEAYGVIEYKPDLSGLAKFKAAIKKRLKIIESAPDRSDNPVSDYIKGRSYLLFDYERHDILRRLCALHAELHDNATTIIRNKQRFLDQTYPIFGVFTRATEDILTNQYIDIGLEVNYALKQTMLALQKLDYLAKLLTVPNEEMRKAYQGIHDRFAEGALAGIFRVKGPIGQLVQDISNNEFVIEHKQPIFRSIFWETSQDDIEKWAKHLSQQEEKQKEEVERGKEEKKPTSKAKGSRTKISSGRGKSHR